ncbi:MULTISPECIES: hypothetical protein [Thermomonospora]|uniref:Cellulose synthase n=1 Tax=Thermomonospora curvata (strain ATCC 19995 / DSM 43183 / JCM 3096 / KCTC 9072 / NBRC 15933 / NCIMB 10081 / Henssen B9) TaxID=471852 RepID=D1A2R2_THECD|nr:MULTISPECIES: hypothetical protein [Thermomonospora]ACY97860.1 hypothetical protein Tcur_2294 [Thermomonospora curvata DSM 43183]PKK14145.1 MAG: hypothetical protein BUE48_011220 [Thermomonospora sp. CIF 1]
MGDGMLFVISLGITLLGLVISYGVGKRRGAASGLRGAAWSLVPLAATLTGVTEFVIELAFSPARWAGVALAGLSVLLYLVSGVMLSKRAGRAEVVGERREERRQRRAVQPPAGAAADPEMAEIEEILRRRGIH